jgi:hypothetical protein
MRQRKRKREYGTKGNDGTKGNFIDLQFPVVPYIP